MYGTTSGANPADASPADTLTRRALNHDHRVFTEAR